MKAIRFSDENILDFNPLLEVVTNLAFDCSFVTDSSGHIIKCSDTSPLVWGIPINDILGQHISRLEEDTAPLSDCVLGDKITLSKLFLINGIICFVHIIPLFNEREEHIGTFCGIVHRGLDKLKSIVEHVYVEDEQEQILSPITRSETRYSFNDFVGSCPEILDVIKMAKRAAKYEYPVLVRGETGTGKELIASGIHTERAKGTDLPFVKINCTAIPRELLESELFGHEKGAFTGAFSRKQGKFEIAGAGTILLDEIGDMEPALQSKLLRVLEDREFERVGGNELIPFRGRIIASTNRNLERMIKTGLFREDLYYRLSTIEITIPPVRNSKEDILLLTNYFMRRSNLHVPFSPGAIGILKNYDWPGNVRQIKNVVAKLSLLEDARIFRADHIREILMPVHHADRREESLEIVEIEPARPVVAEIPPVIKTDVLSDREKVHILDVLDKTGMNLAASARLLGISRNTLYNKIKKYDINLKKVIS
jgi:transcriptional regulator with PAS, ATPase and Fis domain